MDMVCRISDLQYKEIVDIADGTRYGFLSDVELDGERGTVASWVVSGGGRVRGLRGRGRDVAFAWGGVKRIGADRGRVDGGSRRPAARRGWPFVPPGQKRLAFRQGPW